MIRLFIIDIKNRKKFYLDKTYVDAIKLLKKYTYSIKIFVYDYKVLNGYYSDYELSQLSYWYSRQYKIL